MSAKSAERGLYHNSACVRGAVLVRGTCHRHVGHGLVQIGPDGRLQYEYMLKDNQTYTELVVIDPNESCAPISNAHKGLVILISCAVHIGCCSHARLRRQVLSWPQAASACKGVAFAHGSCQGQAAATTCPCCAVHPLKLLYRRISRRACAGRAATCG